MIEQAMFYALGFVSAGLLALAFLPAVWKRAVRLTNRRLSRLVPLSAEEIVAERDQLRAGFAVEQRRLEQKLERVEATRATLLAEIGRHEGRQLALEGTVTRAVERGDGLDAELQGARRDITALEAAAGAAAVALYDLEGLCEQRFETIEAAHSQIRSLESGIDEGRATIASLQTRILGLEARLTDVTQALGVSKAELARTSEAVGRAQAERDTARRTAARAVADGDTLRGDLDRLRREGTGRPEAEPAGRVGPAEVSGPVGRDELKAERDALASELKSTRAARDSAADMIASLRRDLAASAITRDDTSMPTTADIALVRDQLRRLSDEILRVSRADPAEGPASLG